MGEEYKLEGVKPPTTETMNHERDILAGYGHKVMY